VRDARLPGWPSSAPAPTAHRRRGLASNDRIVGTQGDAAFADYFLVAGYSHRFGR